MNDMLHQAERAANFMKGMASPHRLALLCQLHDGEKSVGELVTLTGIPQTSVSQHLAKLKKEGMVDYRRDHRVLYYTITNPVVTEIMSTLYHSFCQSTKESNHV